MRSLMQDPKAGITMVQPAVLAHPCNYCGATEAIRSRRRPLERLLPWLKPFRCAGCYRRFFHPAH